MFLWGWDREEEEYQFLLNLELMATQERKGNSNSKSNSSNSNSSNNNNSHNKRNTSSLLQHVLDDMTFWSTCSESESDAQHNHLHLERPVIAPKRRKARTSGSSTSSSSFAARCANHQKSKTKASSSSLASSPSPAPAPAPFTSYHRSDSQESEKSWEQPIWKTAKDPTTGRTYYYDVMTRQTQWNKPPELVALELKRREDRRRHDKAFFREMESNICDSLAKGFLTPGVCSAVLASRRSGPPREPLSTPPLAAAPRTTATATTTTTTPSRVRTISSMNEILLKELQQNFDEEHAETGHSGAGTAAAAALHPPYVPQQPLRREPLPANWNFNASAASASTKSLVGRPPLPRRSITDETDTELELSPDVNRQGSPMTELSEPPLAGESLLDEPIIQAETDLMATVDRPAAITQHTRRNTGDAIYMQNTIYNPDIQATLKCVCGVYRAHIVQTAERQSSRSPVSVVHNNQHATQDPALQVFQDEEEGSRNHTNPVVPSHQQVLQFYEEFYRRSQMEHDTILMSLIYVERLIKATNGVLTPAPDNWRSILFSCMVLASKVWDDLSMWNSDFSNVSAATAGLSRFTLVRINQLELALLKQLQFDVRVPAGEYAKYYFLIRAMLLRAGALAHHPEAGKPFLQRSTTKDIERRSQTYQETKMMEPLLNSKLPSPSINSTACSRPRPRLQSMDGVLTWLAASSGDAVTVTVTTTTTTTKQKEQLQHHCPPDPILRGAVCVE